jgi:hypothetical protein
MTKAVLLSSSPGLMDTAFVSWILETFEGSLRAGLDRSTA